VEDNIAAVLEMTKLSRKEQKARLETLLNEFHLQHVRKSNGDVVSGGERRRTEIARALAVDPKFILLDEPFAGIDPIAVEDIQSIVAKLKFRNIGILITDHNVTETLSICDRAYLLIEGKIFKHGTAEELAVDEQVRMLYLGRGFELKRKDWLLEDTDKKMIPDVGSIILSVESAISWFEQIEEGEKNIEHSMAYRYSNMAEDLQVKDVTKFLDELKTSLLDFANQTNNPELITKVNQLQTAETVDDAKHDLNSILFLLKTKVIA
jgi:lipopolysaccharide export system ATP-binding protein